MVTQDTYNQLIDSLLKYEDAYYNKDNAIISDAEFDSLLLEAKALERRFPHWKREDSPVNRIMGQATPNLRKVVHSIPLLSLSKAMDKDELRQWLVKIKQYNITNIYSEPKMDGLAAKLIYRNGRLIQASTRGDGHIGNDVTPTCMQMDSIPKSITYTEPLDIRGEIILTKTGLDKINEYLKQKNVTTLLKNVRNAASGLLRDENPDPNKSQYLEFVGYTAYTPHKTHQESMNFIKSLGFQVTDDLVKNKKFSLSDINITLEQINSWVDDVNKQRDNLNCDIDGIVFKCNDYIDQHQLGENESTPNWAIAYKFPQVEKVSILRGVRWDLGAKGTVTPIAIIDPIQLLGVTVTNPTLHNIDEIERLDLKIGDHVVVTRRGDVIPKIVKVLHDLRTGNETEIEYPDLCPVCNQPLTYNQVYITCNNDNCQGRIAGKIFDYASKLEIKGLGEKLIEALVKTNKLTKITDLYRLRPSDISVLDKQGLVSAKKIITNINNSRNAPLARVISGLGIANIGDSGGKSLARFY